MIAALVLCGFLSGLVTGLLLGIWLTAGRS